MLLLSGERVEEKESQDQHYHHIERSYGTFSRSFQLPETADADQIDASFKDGILRVRLPKTEKAQPKQIDVKIQS
jgi:HSP20 family protein